MDKNKRHGQQKFGVWVDKECPLIEDKDDLDGEKAIREVMDKSLLEESIISSLERLRRKGLSR